MKVAILSMQRVVNYGSVLQAYSLKYILSEIVGEDIEFIDIDKSKTIRVKDSIIEDNVDYTPYEFRAKRLGKFILTKLTRKKIERDYVNKIYDFQRNVLCVETRNSIMYDLVVCGSDEVFRVKDKLICQLYGDNSAAIHEITYAACSGPVEKLCFYKEDIPKIKKMINKYEGMSVRDYTTKKYIEQLYEAPIEVHLDPVLVGPLRLRTNIGKRIIKEEYLLVYGYSQRIRSNKEIDEICKYAKRNKLKTVSVGGNQYWTDYYLALSPFEMLDVFYYSSCVVTDTFHGAVFSIINKKSFCVLPRISNEYKIKGLLSLLGIEDRISENIEKLSLILEKTIDYDRIFSVLQNEMEKSYDYLKKHINYIKKDISDRD